MKHQLLRLALLGALATAFDADAMVLGGSNLGPLGYPTADCRKPIPPVRPASFSGPWPIAAYNAEVDRFNMEQERFIACTREYIDNGQNDIKRIQEGIQEGMQEGMQEAIGKAKRY